VKACGRSEQEFRNLTKGGDPNGGTAKDVRMWLRPAVHLKQGDTEPAKDKKEAKDPKATK
jgi:hypothetical protein